MSVSEDVLSELLKLPAHERASLAYTLWESLTETEQEAEFVLTDELRTELRQRIARHEADPDSAILWEEIERRHKALS